MRVESSWCLLSVQSLGISEDKNLALSAHTILSAEIDPFIAKVSPNLSDPSALGRTIE